MSAEAVPLGEGIHRVTLQLPIPSPPAVNCYVIEGATGLTVIDCGVDQRERLDELRDAITDIAGGAAEVERLVCTHMHFDHMGGAASFVREHQSGFVMHHAAGGLLDQYNDWSLLLEGILRWARRSGAPAEDLEALAEWPRPDYAGRAIAPTRPVEDGDRIPLGPDRHLEVLHTPGHHLTHICLRDSRTGRLFSGDHILPRITPFVAHQDDRDALAEYLDSLERIELLDPGTTLPAHGETVEQGRARARQITLHHQRRLGAMTQATRARPATAWEVMTETFRPDLTLQQRFLAFQETLAHLEHLVAQGKLRRTEQNGLLHYTPT